MKTRAAATPFARRVIWFRVWFDPGSPLWVVVLLCVLLTVTSKAAHSLVRWAFVP